MCQFLDLPVELLPTILNQIIAPHQLASCCLVNKRFSHFAIPQLYERIYIYAWHKQGKAKVTQLFTTLSGNPELARWVKKLELRDFPKAYHSQPHESLVDICLRGLANCTSLRSCTWTRDQTLSTEILDVLSLRCPQLRELEINGHPAGKYDPMTLLQFCALSKISLIMPSADVVGILPRWLEKTKETLSALHVLCKSSSLITDKTLETLAPSLTRLKHLHIAGCPKVTEEGLCAILVHNACSLESLGLEGLSSIFNLENLARRIPPLESLSSLTLTVWGSSVNDAWEPGFLALSQRAPLSAIYLYAVGGYASSETPFFLTPEFIKDVLADHAPQLRKLSVHRLRLPPEAVGTICASCPNLESLFIAVDDYELDDLVLALARSRSLRNVHINFFYSANCSRLQPAEYLSIARRLGPAILQLGFDNRVYQIKRVARLNDQGEITIDLELAKFEHPEVPEQFLVTRT